MKVLKALLIGSFIGGVVSSTFASDAKVDKADTMTKKKNGFQGTEDRTVLAEHTGTPKVRREDGKVWIEGVPPTEPVEGVFHFGGLPGMMRTVLEFKGVEAKYLDDVIFAAITGQPFRFWSSPYWEACLALTQEEPLGAVVASVLGFDYCWRPGGDGGANWKDLVEGKKTLDREVVEVAWEELKDEIESGHPVIVFGGAPEVDPKAHPVVVTGYDEHRQLIYFVSIADWRPAPEWDDADPECKEGIKEQGYRARKRPDETNWVGDRFAPGPNCAMGGATISFFAFRDRTHKPTEHEVAMAIIKRAVDFAQGKLREDFRTWIRPGLEAFDFLAESLEQEGEQFEYEGVKRSWTAIAKYHWWYAMDCFGGREHFRTTASAFLRRCAEGFGSFSDKQRKHLESAAQSYDESDAHMGAFWDLFKSVGPLGDYENEIQTTTKALCSWELRKRVATIVRGIRQAEENAISSLEEILALEIKAE